MAEKSPRMAKMIPVRHAIGGLGNLMFKQAYLYAQMRDNVIPDIYVQSQKYWEDYKDEIKALFGHGIGQIDKVALQIRRGDYLDKYNFYVQLPDTNYYQEAVKHFPDDKFLVFCYDRQDPEQDRKDREWTAKFLDTFIQGRWEFHEPLSETDDLNTLASCKAKIIANSTFGWWAGFLGNGKVICPAQWFKDGIQRCELLKEWTLI